MPPSPPAVQLHAALALVMVTMLLTSGLPVLGAPRSTATIRIQRATYTDTAHGDRLSSRAVRSFLTVWVPLGLEGRAGVDGVTRFGVISNGFVRRLRTCGRDLGDDLLHRLAGEDAPDEERLGDGENLSPP